MYRDGPFEVVITYTGSRNQDFAAANRAAGYTVKPEGYTWHHTMDVIQESDGRVTGVMQLVETEAHDAARHNGGVAKYTEWTGTPYND